MRNQTRHSAGLRGLWQQPLLRLLAINLAIGIAVAGLMIGGLLALNPFGLRGLIFGDASPGVALGLLLFGFVVTLGSAAMGSAIMALSEHEPRRDDGDRLRLQDRVTVPAQFGSKAANRPSR
ncbi:MAG: hypothetical protein JWQ94_2773 [Tardiphaga sp.]|jgi:hypothetical protein|nr:hypothetical protein [Tardiphaga sp.]